jgi:preprotein translocase subunit SecE
VVYRGGLENRFGLTADGGSNPSLSARIAGFKMSDTTWIIIWAAVIGALFAFLWRAGHLARLTTYIQQTREELRKCTWPTWEELKGSTVIVAVSIVLLGGFTVLVDFVFTMLVRLIT